MPDAPLHLIRPAIRAQHAYRVPTEVDVPAKLDQNENPYDLPQDVKQAAAERFLATDWNRYPDDRPHALIAALAERLGLTPDGIIVGRGSNELTHSLGLVFLDEGTPIVLPRPMFALFESVARMHDAAVISVDAGEGFRHDPDAILEAAQRSNAVLTIVTTPNNPTGQTLSPDGLERLAAGVPGFLLVDEAYHEFMAGPTALDLMKRHPNVLVMRTFSKALGLAGVRIGMLLGHPSVIQEIEKARLPFLVDRFSEAVALEIMARPELVEARVAELRAEHDRLVAVLGQTDGIEVIPGAANFFLMRTALTPAETLDGLKAHGVRIRNVSSYPALAAQDGRPGWVRVSVGTPDENRAFEVALQHVLAAADIPVS